MPNTPRLRPIRRLPTSAAPADLQLAGGLALLASVEVSRLPAMRWYEVTPPALVLGSSQRLEEVNLAATTAAGIGVYRRSSGGGAVLTEAQLGLDLVLPPDDPLFVADITESYRWLGETWAATLHSLGIETRLISIAEARADTATLDADLKRICYAGLSPYEVAVGRRKLVGLAQRRRKGGALFQAGIYARWQSRGTAALMGASPDQAAHLAARLDGRVVGLADVAPAAPPFEAVARRFEHTLARQTGLTPTADDWTAAEQAARDILAAQYAALTHQADH